MRLSKPGHLLTATFLLLAFAAQSLAAADAVRQYQFAAAGKGYALALAEVPVPVPDARDVIVRVRAVSLNHRDLNMLRNAYDGEYSIAGTIPLSDGAGEVIAVGKNVTRFNVGDRVAGIFFEKWLDGAPSDEALVSDRGGNAGGMLSEVIVSHEDGLVSIPGHLSWEEAATLPCAAVTAWAGLFKRGHIEAGQYVLLEGTGGVSIFGLQLAHAAGAMPVITSSSDAKLELAKSLGAHGTVNYRSHPDDWHLKAKTFTRGHGFDQVLDVVGRSTLPKALEVLANGGHVALIGGLSGYGSDLPTDAIMWINATASGVYVGSRADFEAMNEFIERHKLRPVIDRVFDFDDAAAAFDYLESGQFVGKVVIRL
jgi:NADPH:quinone reductase-like Zn-dependent oxidoreductase